MKSLATQLFNDEAGFIVSAELVLVSSITVLGMMVGLSEVSHNINQELEDVGSAFGSINQSYRFSMSSGKKGRMVGSRFNDFKDDCDHPGDINCDGGTHPEF